MRALLSQTRDVPPLPSTRRSRPRGSHAAVLQLQRTIGNRATRVALARQPTATPTAPASGSARSAQRAFRVMIVDDGKTGLDPKTLESAIAAVRQELQKVTSGSSDPVVKAGFDVAYRKEAPEVGKDIGRRDIGRSTWLIFLAKKGSEKQVVDIGYRYLSLDARDREKYEQMAKQKFASEGGFDLQWQSTNPNKPSESVGFVSVEGALAEEKKQGAGTSSAGRVLAEIILHELGHAMGHVKRANDPDSKDHDDTGIMTASLVVGSGRHTPRSFSSYSTAVIRKRLEWLVGKLPAQSGTGTP